MKRTILLTALLVGVGAIPAQAAPKAVKPGTYTHYPTEIAIGPTLGITGVGLAWRQFALPWLGFQVGANTWGIAHFAGGSVLVSPIHNERGERAYVSAGAAVAFPVNSWNAPTFYPALGVGASTLLRDTLTFHADLSFFPLTLWSTTIPFVAPQFGFLYTF